MKLLIVGFNARPLAQAAKQAGHTIGVCDYFGDMDLTNLTNNCFSVLRQKPNEPFHRPLHRKPPEYLFHLAKIMIEEQGNFDGVLIASGFDNYPNIIEKFYRLGPEMFLNKPEVFREVRNFDKISSLARSCGFKIPKTTTINTFNELITIDKEHTFPLVTRSKGGGGGKGIKLWENKEEFLNYFKENQDKIAGGLQVQEFIKGIDASASVICKDNYTKIVSINEQIIGEKKLFAPGRFSYCGNIVPLKQNTVNTHRFEKDPLYSKIKNLFEQTQLRGSNGIDFVLTSKDVYFMEINPRFQGSLECVHQTTKENIVKLHLQAFHGKKIQQKPPRFKNNSIKGIIFTPQNAMVKIKRYPRSPHIVDRTHYNVILESGDPICSIVFPCKNQAQGYQRVVNNLQKIMRINKFKEKGEEKK